MEKKLLCCGISDLHGYLPEINKCDILLIAGDIIPLDFQRNNDLSKNWFTSEFKEWVEKLPCEKVVFIGGNHDLWFEQTGEHKLKKLISDLNLSEKLIYVKDRLIECSGLTIYGCPWCTGPYGWAFSPNFNRLNTVYEYNKITNCDILLCHQPPKVGNLGISYFDKPYKQDFGSIDLFEKVKNKNMKIVVCGHIHSGEHGGITIDECNTKFYNVSIKNEDYNIAYSPTYFEL